MTDLSPGDVVGGYRIESVAGRGGMGIVYRATHLALDRAVAFKVITPDLATDEDFRERFKRESRIAASLEHPHVVPVYDSGEVDGLLFVAMRFVEGTDLRALVQRTGRLDPRRAAAILVQVSGALDVAHARGLVHRDIKPANILIAGRDGADHAYLTDFGLTKHAGAKSGLTKTGMWVGTVDYVAPEQIEGARVDGRADVYALGCVLYETLTGRVPYDHESDVSKIWAHMSSPPPSLTDAAPDLPGELDAVIARAMAKKPEDRYPSAGDLGRAATAAAEGREATGAERSVAAGAAAPEGATRVDHPLDDVPIETQAPPLSSPPGTGQPPPAGKPPIPPIGQPLSTPSVPAASVPRRHARILGLAAAAVALVAIVAVVLLAGGGDGGSEAYADSLEDVSADLEDARDRLDAITAESTAQADQASFRDALANIEDAQADLEDIDPPSDVESDHEDLADSIEDARDRTEAGADGAVTSSENNLGIAEESRELIDDALDAIDDAG
jgi:serine/threonine protein kinase